MNDETRNAELFQKVKNEIRKVVAENRNAPAYILLSVDPGDDGSVRATILNASNNDVLLAIRALANQLISLEVEHGADRVGATWKIVLGIMLDG